MTNDIIIKILASLFIIGYIGIKIFDCKTRLDKQKTYFFDVLIMILQGIEIIAAGIGGIILIISTLLDIKLLINL